MISDTSDYCQSCQTCVTSKPRNGKLQGKLETMPVLTHPWHYIGVDFVGPLPELSNRDGDYDTICAIIDQLTSMVHLVPTRQNYRAADMAELMFERAHKLHGLPERIISDRDSLFTLKFWKRPHRLLSTWLRMSLAFHPQTDGATERANRTVAWTVGQCVCPDQKDWVTKLPAIEFTTDSARSSTTGFSPLHSNYGRNPSPMIWRGQEEFPSVREFAERMKTEFRSRGLVKMSEILKSEGIREGEIKPLRMMSQIQWCQIVMFRMFVHRVLEIDQCDCALIVDAETYRLSPGQEYSTRKLTFSSRL